LAVGTSIGNRSALVGLLPGADLPECLAVPPPATSHAASKESAQQSQREEIRDQGTEAAAGRPESFGIASCENAHAGCRCCRFRSLHPRLLYRKCTQRLRRISLFDNESLDDRYSQRSGVAKFYSISRYQFAFRRLLKISSFIINVQLEMLPLHVIKRSYE